MRKISEAIDHRLKSEFEGLNNFLSELKLEKEKIETSIVNIPNSFKNIIDMKDYGQSKQILEDLNNIALDSL